MPPPSQRLRRNVSPGSAASSSTKQQGPMRATLPLSLVMRQGSPATTWPRDTAKGNSSSSSSGNNNNNSSSSSNNNNHQQQQQQYTNNAAGGDPRSPPTSPAPSKGDKSKSSSKSSSSSLIRRTASLDAIYLKGQWPRDGFREYCGILLLDKSTQTPDEWNEIPERKRGLQIVPMRSSSVGNGDQISFIRRSLQRNKEGSRPGSSNGQRHSPIHGDHYAVPFLAAGQQTQHVASRPVAIHNIPKFPLMPRMRNSVEGLNQEIERFFVQKGISGSNDERDREPTPDGHRAPIADLFCKTDGRTRTVNTQTPSNSGSCSGGGGDESSHSSGQTSRCHSSSPQIPIIIGIMDPPFYSSQNIDDNQVYYEQQVKKTIKDLNNKSPSPEPEQQKYCSSPHNKFLAREPPDGCERVKIMEEPRLVPVFHDPMKPRDSFILQPSQGSAFCPLQRSCLQATEFALKSVTQATHPTTIEGQ